VPPAVQRVAHSIIERVAQRRPKEWEPRTGAEGVVEYAPIFDAVDCSKGEILVLARNAYVLRDQVEPALRQQGILYEMRGARSVSTSMLGAITAWERLRRGKRETAATVREIYEWMSSGKGVARGHKKLPGIADEEELNLRELKERGGLLRDDEWFTAMDRIPLDEVDYITAIRRRGERLSAKPRVNLSTIHGAKGGQADHVVLMKEMAVRTWNEMDIRPEDEMRCWYVGVTRAKEKLTLVESQTPRACPWL
jgi:hypothetical protein